MYPKLRFKEFSDAWEQRKFKDVGTVSMCKRIFKEKTDKGLYKAKNVNKGHCIFLNE